MTARLFPCPICGATRDREHLRQGEEYCGVCKYLFTLDAQGRCVSWATTNHSHPRGIWGVPTSRKSPS